MIPQKETEFNSAFFVERRPDPEDQRVSRVHLTDAGHAIRKRVDLRWQEIEN